MRVYIIDEVHMLSISAFNALLKIIEEPPEHLLFILATTELHKVPATILSRCQRFAFRRISQEDIAARLQYVAYQEKIDLDDSAARVLARLADGAMRDGLSLLDQCASATVGELNAEKVYTCLGIAGVMECGKLMEHIANHETGKALALVERFYSEGKDMGALLDEMACLTRDFLVLQTAPQEGISMLSGVATDAEVKKLSTMFSSGELSRMMGIIQQTAAGFVRSSSRRMDVELCIVNLCQPELTLDAEAVNARITRLEEQMRSGTVTFMPSAAVDDEECPPMPDDMDAPPEETQLPQITQEESLPIGFWAEMVSEIRSELKPPVSGFFVTTPNAPIVGVLRDNKLLLVCSAPFIMDVINKPEILEMISRKASAKLRKPIRAVAADKTAEKTKTKQMEQLLRFGKEHADIINIK